MPLNPPPTIDPGLCLITQKLQRSDMSRAAEVTYAVVSLLSTSPTHAQDIVDDLQTHWNTDLMPDFDAEVTALPPSIRMGDGTTVPTEATASGAAVIGGSAVTTPPPQVALLVKKLTPFGGRRNRGRMFVPFFINAAGMGENGVLTTATVTALQTTFTTWYGHLGGNLGPGGSIPMVIANKTINHATTPPAVTAVTTGPTVSSLLVESMVATQRRRVGR